MHREGFLQNNRLHFVSPKIFGQLLSTRPISIDISGNYGLNCKQLCWLNYDAYRSISKRLTLLNHMHCNYDNHSMIVTGPWNEICRDWCNTDQMTFTVQMAEIKNSDALSQLLNVPNCINCYQCEDEESVFKAICYKATGNWFYNNKCRIVKCKRPPKIKVGKGTILGTREELFCGEWVEYLCEPGYKFDHEDMQMAQCTSPIEGSLTGEYRNVWTDSDTRVLFVTPKCILSSEDGKRNGMKDIHVIVGICLGSVILGSLLTCVIIYACNRYNEKRTCRTDEIQLTNDSVINRRVHVNIEQTRRSSCPDSNDNNQRIMHIFQTNSKPVPLHVMRLSALYDKIKKGDSLSSRESVSQNRLMYMNEEHFYEQIKDDTPYTQMAKPGPSNMKACYMSMGQVPFVRKQESLPELPTQ